MCNSKYTFSFCLVQQMDFNMLIDTKEEGLYCFLVFFNLDGNFMIGISATMPIIKSY